MAKIRLSHSAKDKYTTCPKMYEYHYIQKLRPKGIGAALIFGNALDNAINELLLPTGKNAEDLFETLFTNSEIAGKTVFVPTSPDILYTKTNFDSEILISEDYEIVYQQIKEMGIQCEATQTGVINKYKEIVKLDNKSISDIRFYNLLNWLSLYRKGLLMLTAYRKNVLPFISKVIASQETINLENQDGDTITGIVDLVAEIDGYGTVIFDNKTSSMRYKDDSVKTSEQLALYVNALYPKYKTNQAGYIVLNKQVKKNRIKICKSCGYNGGNTRAKTCDALIDDKRCSGEWDETINPEIGVQIIIDTIDEEMQDKIIEVFDLTTEKIKAKAFDKNLNSCDNQYGQRCAYYNLCHNNDPSDLLDLNKKVLDKS